MDIGNCYIVHLYISKTKFTGSKNENAIKTVSSSDSKLHPSKLEIFTKDSLFVEIPFGISQFFIKSVLILCYVAFTFHYLNLLITFS